MAKKDEITTKESTELVSANDYSSFDGMGYENQSGGDIIIPFITLLQAGSPQLKTNKNAKAGMFYNSVTSDIYEDFELVPASTQHVFVEWIPREKGGGMVGFHDVNASEVVLAKQNAVERNKLKLPNGNDLVETFYMYGMLLQNDLPSMMVVLSFSSTKIKAYRNINTRLRMFTLKTADGRKIRPPIFAHRLRVSSIEETNKKGDYYNFHMDPAVGGDIEKSLLPPTHPAFEAAREHLNMINQGLAKVDMASQRPDADEDSSPHF